MTDRCDLTDLLVDQCAHCRKDDAPELDDIQIQRTFTATYAGRCALEVRHKIEVGDRIGHAAEAGGTPVGWVCAWCTEQLGGDR